MSRRLPAAALDPTGGDPKNVPAITDDGTRVGWVPPGDLIALTDLLDVAVEGAEPGQFLAFNGVTWTPSDGGGDGLWRGEWTAAPDELAYEKDFSVDLTPFTGTGVQTTMAAAIGNNDPAYSHVMQAYFGTSNTGGTAAKLAFADVPALVGRIISRVKLYVAGQGNNTAVTTSTFTFRIKSNGTERWVQSISNNGNPASVTTGWTEVEIANPLVDIEAHATKPGSFCEARMAVTGVRVYVVTAGWSGYQTGEYVHKDGIVYRSLSDNNTHDPTDVTGPANWTPVAIYATPKTPNAQTGTAYTLALTDAAKLVTMNNAAASTLTVPPNSTVAFPVGSRLDVTQLGAGVVTITPGAGVTITGDPKVLAVNATVQLVKTGTDTWRVLGFRMPPQAPNAQVGTTYTLTASDAHRLVTLTNAAAIALTIPTNATVPFPIGTRIEFVQGDVGVVTAAGAVGVTLNGSGATTGQWDRRVLIKTATDTWICAD